MQADQLRQAIDKLYPPDKVHGGQTRLAEALGVDASTVRRWLSGAVPIPNPVEAAVKCFLGRMSDTPKKPAVRKSVAHRRKKR